MLALTLTIVFHPVRTVGERVLGWLASVIVLLSTYLLIVVLALAMIASLGQLAALVPHYGVESRPTWGMPEWLGDRG